MKFRSLDYLCKSTHGKNLVIIMKELALKGLANKYELHQLTGLSYALVHKSMKELAGIGFLYYYGQRHIDRRPGRKKSKYKHETKLWGLSFLGLWTLIQADEKILGYWKVIRENHNGPNRLGNALDFFELILKIGRISEEYGYVSYHNYPGPSMVAQAMIFYPAANERQVEHFYEDFTKKLLKYPRGTSKSILYATKQERENLSKYLTRCIALQERLETSARSE